MLDSFTEGKSLNFRRYWRIISVSQSLRRPQRSLLAMAKKNLPIARQKFGAVSRSVDWYLLLKVGGIAGGVVGLLCWQWQLLVATGLGISVMGAIYFAYDAPWEKYLETVYQLWQGEYRRLLLAVLGGGTTVFVSYLAIALWQSTGNHWLATASIMQGLMIGAILLIAGQQTFGTASQMRQFEASLEALSHDSSVKRLYALRQLRQLLQKNLLTPAQKKTLYTFLRLTWQQEEEAVLRGALLSTLSLYKKKQAATQPLRPIRKSRPPLNLEQCRQPQSFEEPI